MSKTTDTAPKATTAAFTFAPKLGLTIPEDAGSSAPRPNVLVDDFFTPALAHIMADEKVEPYEFFPVAYFQQGSDAYATKNGKSSKKLGISDARQKISDAFKKWQKAKATASIAELIMVNRTGKEGLEGITEPGVMAFLRMKKR